MEFEKKSVETIKQELLDKLRTAFGSGLEEATDDQVYQALAQRLARHPQADGREEGVLPERGIPGGADAAHEHGQPRQRAELPEGAGRTGD